MCICNYTYIHTYVYIYIHIRIYECTYVCMYEFMHVCMYVCMYLCINMYMHMYVYIYTNTYIKCQCAQLEGSKRYTISLFTANDIPILTSIQTEILVDRLQYESWRAVDLHQERASERARAKERECENERVRKRARERASTKARESKIEWEREREKRERGRNSPNDSQIFQAAISNRNQVFFSPMSGTARSCILCEEKNLKIFWAELHILLSLLPLQLTVPWMEKKIVSRLEIVTRLNEGGNPCN